LCCFRDGSIKVDVVGESDLDDSVDTFLRAFCNGGCRVGLVKGDELRNDGRVHLIDRGAAPHGSNDYGTSPACQLRGQGSDAAEDAVHEDRLASYRSVCEDSPVRGDTRDAEAGTDLAADLIGQIDCLFRRNHGELSRGAEWSVGLRPVQPHAPTDPTGSTPGPTASTISAPSL